MVELMNRIIKRILIIAMCIAFFAFAAYVTVDMIAFSKVLKRTMDDKIRYENCQFANRLSMIFENAEGSVDSLCADIKNEFDVDSQMRNSSYINEFIYEHSPIIRDALIDIEDSQGLFLTFAPEITDKQKAYEIWYSYDKNGQIINTDPTSNGIYYEAFDDSDIPTMQYYFNAIDSRGEGVWTEPWYDSDINEELITYSRAVYSGDTLIGVMGTDIYTEYTIDFISSMEVENGGMIFLLNENNDQIISSSNVKKTDILESEEFWDTMAQNMCGKNSGLFDVEWNEELMRVSFSQLSNDWKLATVHYKNKLYSTYRSMLSIVVILSILLTAMLLTVMFFALRHFSSPVDKAIELLNVMDLENQIEDEDTANIKGEDDIVLIVKKAMKRQRMKDILIANQSRFAAVGEMMANVTHQWKQPLNNINIIMGNLKDDIKNGNMNEDDALLAVQKVETLTVGMSKTLSDFSDCLKPDVEVVAFDVKTVVEAVLDLLKDKLKARNIFVSVKCDEGLISYGYKNSLYHALLNVINNAIDAIDDKKEHNGIIDISIKRSFIIEKKIVIEIFNNGVQLSEKEISNLFKPYYTTKGKKDGTGLGLAISKSFIEDSMNGEISLENYGEGVRCVITINEKEEHYDG